MAIAWISWVFDEVEVTGGQRLVLLALAYHADDKGICWPGMDTIAKKAGLSRRRAEDGLRGLITAGLVVRVVNGGPAGHGGYRTNLYRLVKKPTTSGPDSSSPPNDSAPDEQGSDGPAPDATSGGDDTSDPGNPRSQDFNDPGGTDSEPPDGQGPGDAPPPDDSGGDDLAPDESSFQGGTNRPSSPGRNVRSGHDETSGQTVREPPDEPSGESSRLEPVSDAERLCHVFADSIAERGSKRPGVSKAWITDMDRLLRIDGREPGEVERVIRWLSRGADEIAVFWRPNVRCPSKLRAQWDQMREQYQSRGNRSNGGKTSTNEAWEASHDYATNADPDVNAWDQATGKATG